MEAGDKSMGMRRGRVKLGVFMVFIALFMAEVCFGPGGWVVRNTSAQDGRKSTSLARTVADQKAGKTDAAMSSTPAIEEKRQESAMEGDQLTPKSPAAFDPNWKR